MLLARAEDQWVRLCKQWAASRGMMHPNWCALHRGLLQLESAQHLYAALEQMDYVGTWVCTSIDRLPRGELLSFGACAQRGGLLCVRTCKHVFAHAAAELAGLVSDLDHEPVFLLKPVVAGGNVTVQLDALAMNPQSITLAEDRSTLTLVYVGLGQDEQLEVQYARVVPNQTQPSDCGVLNELCGLWQATFGAHGEEVIHVTRRELGAPLPAENCINSSTLLRVRNCSVRFGDILFNECVCRVFLYRVHIVAVYVPCLGCVVPDTGVLTH